MTKKKADRKNLTEKQANFAFEYIANGRNASDAYRKIYAQSKNTTSNVIWKNAHTILHNTKVQTRINELQLQQYDGDIMSLKERKLALTKLARDGDTKSIDMLNKMDGVYIEKQKVELIGDITLILE